MSQIHPLSDCVESYINTWSQWKEEWATTKLYEYKAALIRRGFYTEASEEESIERLTFYFQMADGHLTGEGLGAKEEYERHWETRHPMRRTSWPNDHKQARVCEWELKQYLAKSAYGELVYHFFSSREDNDHRSVNFRYPWMHWLKNPKLMKVLLKFFRVADGKVPNFDSWLDEDKKKNKIVREALVQLCGARWGIGISSICDNWSEHPLEENWDFFLELLFGLKALDIFLKHQKDRRPGLVHLEQAELDFLRKIVLSERSICTGQFKKVFGLGVEKPIWRAPTSVHEALSATDSQAARVYVTLCARQKVEWLP